MIKREKIINDMIDMSHYKEALDLIEKSRYILIITHVNPDPDTISSALALSNVLYENRIKHKVFNVSSDLPRNLDFISRFDKITNQIPPFYDLVISVDCATKKRFGIEVDENVPLINIDHHISNPNFGKINIVNYKKTSTAEVVYDFFKFNGLYITSKSATAMYVGIYEDSLAFTNNRCDDLTFEKINYLVKCGANPAHIANKLTKRDSLAKYRLIPKVLNSLKLYKEAQVGVIYVEEEWLEETGASLRDAEVALDMVMNISVIKVAMFLRIANGKTRVSLRSKDDIDVSKVALIFEGGGHTNAAGFSLQTIDLNKAKDMVLAEVLEINI